MLRKNKEDGYWRTNLELTSMQEIERIERLVTNKQKMIEDLQYELALLKNDRLKIYKTNVWYIISEFCDAAQKWVCALENGTINGKKLDKRKNYKEKDAYNYLYDWMCKHLDVDDLEITNIIKFGYSTEAYEVQFNALNHKWELYIPVVSNVSMKSCEHGAEYYFKLRISNCDRDHVFSHVCSTYSEDELGKLFKENRERFM